MLSLRMALYSIRVQLFCNEMHAWVCTNQTLDKLVKRIWAASKKNPKQEFIVSLTSRVK